MTAREVKDALRLRHPASDGFGGAGQWTCIEEWHNIDLLAFNAWASGGPRYGRVGYEVKVSRSDYRRELLNPGKRAGAVAFCHEFYFAVPLGLLTDAEVAWEAPGWLDAAAPPFDRPKCPGAFGAWCTAGRVTFGRGPLRSRFGNDRWYGAPDWVEQNARRAAEREARGDRGPYSGECPTCRGTGYLVECPAVLAGAPKLWVPADVGLIVVAPGVPARIAKRAPRRTDASLERALTDHGFAELVRWVSVRPDPRHAELRR